MKKKMFKYIGSCQEFTEMLSKRQVVDLTWRERIRMKLHGQICLACARHRRQEELIDKYLETGIESNTGSLVSRPELKQRILDALGGEMPDGRDG